MASGSVELKVTNDYIAQAAASCKKVSGTVQDELASLRTYIQNMESYWRGIASGTFQDLMTEYQTYSVMLCNALTDIGDGLEGNSVNYHGTEAANLKTVQAIQDGLAGTNFS